MKRRILQRLAAALAAGTLAWILTAGTVAAAERGYLGVTIQELTPSLREALKLGDRTGLVITGVEDDSPADRAGLREEDVILSYDGKPVEKLDDLIQLVRGTKPGTEVRLRIFRDGEEKEVHVTIGRLPGRRRERFSIPGEEGMFVFRWPPRLGIQIHDLNKDLASYFNLDSDEGVLVLEVIKDSPADKAGIRAGDVIVAVNDEAIRDSDDLYEALEEVEKGDEITVEFVRHGKREKVTVTVGGEDRIGRRFRIFIPPRGWERYWRPGWWEHFIVIDPDWLRQWRQPFILHRDEIERIKGLQKMLHGMRSI